MVRICVVFGCGGKTHFGRRAKPVKYVAPARVCVGGAAMALVYDDEVEEIARVLLVVVGVLVLKLLVKCEVQFMGRVDVVVVELSHRLREWGKVVLH